MQLLVGDIEVVTTEEAAHTDTGCTQLENNQVKQIHTSTAIQVAENDPILNKAHKLDHLCTLDRDYFLLESDTVTADEYAKLSLDSETTTDDSHVQQLSLPHCDDSLSTTVSEESDCTVAVRVYDLNKRETKILRHDIIKRSRNPIGGSGDLINTSASLHNLGNCCSNSSTSINNSETNQSNQQLQHQQNVNNHCIESANETRKPPRSPTNKLRSVHLNRNPRKLKMADVQLMNDAFGTSLDPKIIDELKRKNGEIHVENANASDVPNNSAVIVSVTENLLESERNASDVCADVPEKVATTDIMHLEQQPPKPDHDEHVTDATIVATVASNDNTAHVLVNECANQRDESNVYNVESNNNNDTTTNTIITTTTISTTTSATSATIISEKNNNISNSNSSSSCITTTNENVASKCIMENSEQPLSTESMPLIPIETNTKVDKSQIMVGTITHEQKSSSSNQQLKTFERSYEVIVQVNEHKEKSVIEEDVIPALPSVKELARSFSTKRDPDARPEKLQRPKVSVLLN